MITMLGKRRALPPEYLHNATVNSMDETRLGMIALDHAADALVSPEIPFVQFVKEAWPVIEPSTSYVHNWHIDVICEYLESVASGLIKRLVVSMPPRYGKSILVSIMWPVWLWTQKPWLRFIFVSYSNSLSTKHSLDRRNLIRSSWFQRNWGNIVNLSPDQNLKTEFQNEARGVMTATSVGGTVTGKGGDVIILDDPLNPEEAESKPERERAVNFVGRTLSTRLNDKKNGSIIMVGQRLHANDVASKLIVQKAWTHLSLQAIAEEDTKIHMPITKKIRTRPVGDVLWKEREPMPILEMQKIAMGSRHFSAQYQQNPSSDDANFFKRDWWRFYKVRPDGFDVGCQTWDLAFKDHDTSSYVAGYYLVRRGPDIYVMDEVHAHLNFPATEKAIVTFTNKWPATMKMPKLIEDTTNGPAVIATLQKKIPGIIPVRPEGSKVARASAVSASVESGNVWLPDPLTYPDARWVHDFIEEFARFPAEPNDRVDAISQGLLRLQLLNVTHEGDEAEEVSFMPSNGFNEFGFSPNAEYETVNFDPGDNFL